MSGSLIRLATRGSALALWQARRVADLISQAAPRVRVELEIIRTKPDRLPDVPLQAMGGDKGLFVKELELAILHGRADAAVHSLKDVPVEQNTAGLTLVAFPERADPGEVLLVRDGACAPGADPGLATLKAGAVVATSALRRQAQLVLARPDLQVTGVRGNVDTRIAKLRAGEFDAIIMAAAGLDRLGLEAHVSQRLPIDHFLPAPGQGTLAVQAPHDSPFAQVWAQIDSKPTRIAAETERQFSRRIGATCHSAAACLLETTGSSARFRTAVYSPEGSKHLFAEASGPLPSAMMLAQSCADDLLARGCSQLMR
jgi:hydroxymethylbilane synthase